MHCANGPKDALAGRPTIRVVSDGQCRTASRSSDQVNPLVAFHVTSFLETRAREEAEKHRKRVFEQARATSTASSGTPTSLSGTPRYPRCAAPRSARTQSTSTTTDSASGRSQSCTAGSCMSNLTTSRGSRRRLPSALRELPRLLQDRGAMLAPSEPPASFAESSTVTGSMCSFRKKRLHFQKVPTTTRNCEHYCQACVVRCP